MSTPDEKLPVAALERIDGLCADFENSWQSGNRPTIEPALGFAKSAKERNALLAELLVLDIDYRRKHGEQPKTDDYLKLFPENEDVVRRAFKREEEMTKGVLFEPPTIARMTELFPSLEVLELIGAGGMGAVYKARQKGLDRTIAIKILPDEIGGNPTFALRFTREARALARLNHPHIVSVYEFGNAEGTYYFLMEYVDGTTLRDVIQTHQLTPAQALAIVPYLCDALQYAHDQGVVHRDIKPENILLDRSGRAKIADFGLSRLLGSENADDLLTGTHQVMGTLRYMAPEQMQGAHSVDHRADIYSLGVVFYEMLTGELPLGRFAAPSEKVHIDVRLDDVVLRTLEQEPRRRYQHASQVKSDLESITSSTQQTLAPTGDLTTNKVDSGRESRSTQLEKQELTSRLLLLRRQLMSRVEDALRPLFWGQILQMVIGVLFIVLGVYCWARNQNVPHRLISGIVLHVYGTLLIVAAGLTAARISRLDCSKAVAAIREQLDSIRDHYLRAGIVLGLSWWLLWIPVGVACGFDAIAYPTSFWPSFAIGGVGLITSLVLFKRFARSNRPWAKKWKQALEGESLTAAYRDLDEIAQTEE